jgi:hypothetical protein
LFHCGGAPTTPTPARTRPLAPTTTIPPAPTTTTTTDGPVLSQRRPTDDIATIVSFINEITLSNQTIRYPSRSQNALDTSAEERAVRWLIEDDHQTAPTNWLALRQRYVLATLWFGSLLTTTCRTRLADDAGYATTWVNPDVNECDWRAVECSDDGVITVLEFYGVNGNGDGDDGVVLGRILDDVGLLSTGLTSLQLYDNTLTEGTIPSTLGRLTGLRYLSLYGNSLTGTIPHQLGQLTTRPLIGLDLEDNVLDGTIPSTLSALTALTELWLSRNRLTGSVPSQLSALTALSLLSLYGIIPTLGPFRHWDGLRA